jgi:hypothetical protein
MILMMVPWVTYCSPRAPLIPLSWNARAASDVHILRSAKRALGAAAHLAAKARVEKRAVGNGAFCKKNAALLESRVQSPRKRSTRSPAPSRGFSSRA